MFSQFNDDDNVQENYDPKETKKVIDSTTNARTISKKKKSSISPEDIRNLRNEINEYQGELIEAQIRLFQIQTIFNEKNAELNKAMQDRKIGLNYYKKREKEKLDQEKSSELEELDKISGKKNDTKSTGFFASMKNFFSKVFSDIEHYISTPSAEKVGSLKGEKEELTRELEEAENRLKEANRKFKENSSKLEKMIEGKKKEIENKYAKKNQEIENKYSSEGKTIPGSKASTRNSASESNNSLDNKKAPRQNKKQTYETSSEMSSEKSDNQISTQSSTVSSFALKLKRENSLNTSQSNSRS